ncbi:MAG: hypothetical protein HQL36_11305, partial [Alphaproteobacteria bacterium]|nr:hypothetical protein [Alphaproteobacteria bacterium]
GRVMRLETLHGDPVTGVAQFELSLRDEKTGKLVVLGEYGAEKASGKNGVQTDVSAIEKAVDEAFRAFVADIAKK